MIKKLKKDIRCRTAFGHGRTVSGWRRAAVLTVFICVALHAGLIQADAGMLKEPETFHMTRKLQADQPEEPEETYWDRDGNQYALESWEMKEIPEHMASRNMEKQIVYAGVEGAEGLPESISVTEEISGVPAGGKLYIRDSRTVKEEWLDGFETPVVFHSYGADEYQVGTLAINGEDVLSGAVAVQEELLGIMGLSPDEYRILSMEWAGEAFVDDEGQMCRQASAAGQKLVRDVAVTYEGEVSYMEPVSYEMEMVYRPVLPSDIQVEDPLPAVQVREPEPVPAKEESTLWYWVRSGFVITVGAGLIGIGIGILILAASWLGQRRKERQGRYLPQIKG